MVGCGCGRAWLSHRDGGGDGGSDVGGKEESWSGEVEGGLGFRIVTVELTVEEMEGEKGWHGGDDGRGDSGRRWWGCHKA